MTLRRALCVGRTQLAGARAWRGYARAPGPWGFAHARPSRSPAHEPPPVPDPDPAPPSALHTELAPAPAPEHDAARRPSKWPPALVAVCAGVSVLVLYTGLMMREATLEELADDLRWGGEQDALHALGVLTRWLALERLGIGTSHALPRPLPAPLLDDVLGALSSPHNTVRTAALRVLCLCSPELSPLRDATVVPLIRRSVCEGNVYALTLLGTLATHKSVARAIASDRALVRNLLLQTATLMARGLIEDRVAVRACLRVWAALVLHDDARAQLGASHERALKNLCARTALPLDTRSWPAFTALTLALQADAGQWAALLAASGQGVLEPARLQHDEAVTQAGLGATVVALSALAMTRYRQWTQWRTRTPTLYDRRRARPALMRAPLLAVALWASLHALTYVSAALSDRMALGDARFPSWTDTNTRAPLVAALPLLGAIPLCVAASRLAPTALIPALLPWPLTSPVPPLYLPLLRMVRSMQARWFLRGPDVTPVDPTPAELEALVPEARLWD